MRSAVAHSRPAAAGPNPKCHQRTGVPIEPLGPTLMRWSAPALASWRAWNQFPVSISFVLALVFIMAPTRNNRSALPWVTYLVASQSSPITPAPLLLTLEELGYPVDWLYTI